MTEFSEIATDTVTLSYLDAGEGPVIVALHGFPDSWRTWDAFAPALVKAGYRVIRLALRGYAPSGIPADARYDVPALAGDVLGLLDRLAIGRAVVLGHDWGASIAYELAERAPHRLAALIALAVPPPATAIGGWAERIARPHNIYLGYGAISDWWFRRAGFAEVRRLYRLWSPGWTGNDAHIDTVIGQLSDPARSRAAVDCYRPDPHRSSRPALPTMPSLLIYGAHEPKVRRHGFEGARAGLGAHSGVVGVEGAGHWPHLEAPGRVLEAVIGFLGRCVRDGRIGATSSDRHPG
ncbi:alpha/beta hydrolase [Sulfitobacter sp. LCG007]